MVELEEWVETPPPTKTATVTTIPYSFPCLEELIVQSCGKLRTAPSQFPAFEQLQLKYVGEKGASSMLNGVPEFKNVPKRFLQSNSCEHVQSVFIRSCHKFQGFVAGEGELPVLFFSKLKKITFESCPNVKSVDVRGLTSLECFCLEITGYIRPESSILGLQSLRALQHLTLEKIPIIMQTGCDAIRGGCCWPHLQMLEISSAMNVMLTTTHFPSRRIMKFCSNNRIAMEPAANINLALLTHLSIFGVKDFTTLPQGLLHSCSKHLQELNIGRCFTFQCFSENELQILTSVKELYIEGCPSLTCLDVNGLVYLKKMTVKNCRGIKSSIEGLQSLPLLHTLLIGEFSEELDHFPFFAMEEDNASPLLLLRN